MPRHIPGQVTQSVSRLLEGRYLKAPPAWYEPTIRHPPTNPPPLYSRVRPDSDLPRAMQSDVREARKLAANKAGRRTQWNSLKKLRSQMPPLRPQPIVYEADRIRRQFFRDHPWEAKRPKVLTEMDYVLDEPVTPNLAPGQLPELSMWSRFNPSVEDVVQCTLKTAECSDMSLSQAYRRTIASFHAVQAEREQRLRFAILEARNYGADFGLSETERGFAKEAIELGKWAVTNAHVSVDEANEASSKRGKRTKRADDSFSAGAAYMDSAKSISHGQSVQGISSVQEASTSTSTPAPSAQETASSDDYLGLGTSFR